MITELAQEKVFARKALQPGGTAIMFPKGGQNQNLTPLCGIKKPFIDFNDMNILSSLEPFPLPSKVERNKGSTSDKNFIFSKWCIGHKF